MNPMVVCAVRGGHSSKVSTATNEISKPEARVRLRRLLEKLRHHQGLRLSLNVEAWTNPVTPIRRLYFNTIRIRQNLARTRGQAYA